MSDFIILALILFLVLSLIVTIVLFVLYSGLLSEIVIRTGSPPIKKITIAYKFKEGPYKDCGASFTEACSIGPKLSCIGVYYDDPKQVPEDKCRYAVGSILSEGDEKPDEDLLKEYEKYGFSLMSFPEVDHAVTTTFPNRSPISPYIASYRVYPQLAYYIEERALSAAPFMEFYKDDVIHYMCPLSRQNSFFVPEVRLVEKKEEGSDDDGSTDVTGGDSNSESSYGSRAVPTESRETSLAPSTIPEEEQEAQEEQGEQGDRAEHSERGSDASVGSGSSFEELGLEEEEEEEEEVVVEEKKREDEPREEEGSPNKAAAPEEKEPAVDGEE
ncbi:testis-expressed protein 264 homolog [Clupea harengus]|uniref:Testis-expressed protein 264 homolog n=1 Tax=Clupea harengus TaxID=7950 RepID=A0A6P3W421_CLUHA|nr:testis-expressed protein 264 homolog [Clupea harengus]